MCKQVKMKFIITSLMLTCFLASIPASYAYVISCSVEKGPGPKDSKVCCLEKPPFSNIPVKHCW